MTIKALLCLHIISSPIIKLNILTSNTIIRDKVFARMIELTYMPIANIIADGLIKLLMYTKFDGFLEQMHIIKITRDQQNAPKPKTEQLISGG